MLYKKFSFTLGYAEYQRTTKLLLNHKTGFEDPIEALKNLNDILLSTKYVNSKWDSSGRLKFPEIGKDCCREFISKNNGDIYKFCPMCGESFYAPEEDDIIYLEEVWLALFEGDVNSIYSKGIWDALDSAGWSLTEPSGENWVKILKAENIYEMWGFIISAKDLYDNFLYKD